jgi:hypothetical protein
MVKVRILDLCEICISKELVSFERSEHGLFLFTNILDGSSRLILQQAWCNVDGKLKQPLYGF